jgi:hypothetical protein
MVTGVIAVTLLGGCAGSQITQANIAWVPAGDERITFRTKEFDDGAVRRVIYPDSWQREEYALFQGEGARAEIIYSTTAEDNRPLALDYKLLMMRSIDSWNFNRNRAKTWGKEGQVGAGPGLAFYRPYRLGAQGPACFAFTSDWGHPSGDPVFRPGKVMFGYYCAAAGETLSAERIEDLILGIGIRGVTERLPRRRDTAVAARDSTGAAAAARGDSTNADRGNAEFPFNFAVMYQDADGSVRTN